MEKNILFSKKAFRDGYDFSHFSKAEQEATNVLYTNSDDMIFLKDRYISANMYIRNKYVYGVAPLYDKDWRFFEDGDYDGIIVDVRKPHTTNNGDYIIDILIDTEHIKHIKFMPYSDLPVAEAIRNEIEDENSIVDLIGRWVEFKIENVYRYGKSFSNVLEFEFFDSFIENLYKKMIIEMEKAKFTKIPRDY